MRAVLHTTYGSPDLLQVGEIERPTPKPDEVLIEVRAASLHADVWHVITGHPRFMRLMGQGVRRPKHVVPGSDCAGVVVGVGRDVTRFAIGDEVFAETIRSHQWMSGGAWAELATAPEQRTSHKPAAVSFEQASCVPTTGLVALDLLLHQGRFSDGDSVLINGGGGAVGTQLVQIAKARGAHVTVVDTGARLELAGRLGADALLDFHEHDITRLDQHFQVVIDFPGTHPWRRVRRIVAADGTYVLVGHDGFTTREHPLVGAMSRVFPLLVRSLWTKQLTGFSSGGAVDARMEMLRGLLERGELTPVVDASFPLEQAPVAMRQLVAGSNVGRLVLAP